MTVHEIVCWLTCPLGRGVRAEEVKLQRDASWLATCRQGIRHGGFSVHVVDYLSPRWQDVYHLEHSRYYVLTSGVRQTHAFNEIFKECPRRFHGHNWSKS